MKSLLHRASLAWLMVATMLAGTHVHAADDENTVVLDGPELSSGSENASNPLAAVSNTDLRWQYADLTTNAAHLNDYYIDGALMLNPKLKF